MTIKNSSKPKKNEKILLRDMKDGIILYDVDRGKAHVLNLFASYIWDHCDSQHSVKEIIETIEEELKELKKDHSKEVISTLKQFAKEGLVVLQE